MPTRAAVKTTRVLNTDPGKVFVTDMTMMQRIDERPEAELTLRLMGALPDPRLLMQVSYVDFAPEQVVVKCVACGQYGARFCECAHCGRPID